MRWLPHSIAFTLTVGLTASAQAFCGFYVKEDDTRLTARASRVVLLRDGLTTVMSMQNSYEGPPEDFAMIVPVPTSIGAEDVRTLESDVFERLDRLTSPRLVEYWERAPTCLDGVRGYGGFGYGRGGGSASVRVRVESAFAVGEYDVVILSAEQSDALGAWLRAEGYRLPDGAEAALRPYVERGYRFFAARVNADRVRFEDGRALLSPLRIRYESEQLALPVRLGMLNSPGQQDLIVHVISREGRFEVANRDNVFVPTNLEVRRTVRGRFGAFYDGLLDRVWRTHPGHVVTEYAWTTSRCDPCPGPPMNARDLTTLGGDVATGAVLQEELGAISYAPSRRVEGPMLARPVSALLQGASEAIYQCVESPETFEVALTVHGRVIREARVRGQGPAARCIEQAIQALSHPSSERPASERHLTRVRVAIHVDRRVSYAQPNAHGFTVTRMRYRYDRESPATDLVFRAAPPVRGGVGTPDEAGRLDPNVRTRSGPNTFQARYAILHRRRPPTRQCRHWAHGGWGGPPSGRRPTRTAPALGRRRRAPPIERLLRSPVPSLRLQPARRRRRAARGPAKTGRTKPIAISAPAVP